MTHGAPRGHALVARRALAMMVAAWVALFGACLPVPDSAPSASTSPARAQPQPSGRILAVIGRQVGFLNFDAPRPRILTAFSAPRFAIDVAAVPATSIAAIAVAEPVLEPLQNQTPGQNQTQPELGGDLLGLDLAAPDRPPFGLVMRADAAEWLGAPAWLPDGSGLLFQREDVRAGSDLLAGQAGVRYPSRIEMANPDGTSRRVVVGYGHHPSPSPDGSEIAFVRLSSSGPMLLAHDMTTAEERTLVSAGRYSDVAYPRFSPGGDLVAFVATSAMSHVPPTILGPHIAYAHGLPWDVWIVGRDGAGLRELAAVNADDASLAWSPDGSSIFVYASSGARLIDANTGLSETLTYLAGFGAISWLADS